MPKPVNAIPGLPPLPSVIAGPSTSSRRKPGSRAPGSGLAQLLRHSGFRRNDGAGNAPTIIRALGLSAAAVGLVGCDGVQSALNASGSDADAMAQIGTIMFVGAGLILLLVVVLTAIAILLPRSRRQWLGGSATVVWGGIVFPVVTLTALLIYGFTISRGVGGPAGPDALRIHVAGEMWWWRVQYLDGDGNVQFETANEVRLPVGQPVEFVLTSDNVIHSFWIPPLGGKLDMIPGHVNRMSLEADEPGIYRGQCAEYCGLQHARMAFDVIAYEPEEFEAWMESQRAPASEPRVAFLERGREVFLSTGCGACHTIRGTEADGTLGPDLTHVGGRPTIAAGTFPNNVGTLAGWISDSQHLKPGNMMPSFDMLEGEELRAVAAYLESLK